jgi:hypothetical protein
MLKMAPKKGAGHGSVQNLDVKELFSVPGSQFPETAPLDGGMAPFRDHGVRFSLSLSLPSSAGSDPGTASPHVSYSFDDIISSVRVVVSDPCHSSGVSCRARRNLQRMGRCTHPPLTRSARSEAPNVNLQKIFEMYFPRKGPRSRKPRDERHYETWGTPITYPAGGVRDPPRIRGIGRRWRNL